MYINIIYKEKYQKFIISAFIIYIYIYRIFGELEILRLMYEHYMKLEHFILVSGEILRSLSTTSSNVWTV